MKILLTAINAKYIHSNLAVYSLKAYANQKIGNDVEIEIAEYTINQQLQDIMRDIYEKHADVLCLSCYIWNLQYVEELVRELHKVCPDMEIWLGGPEVSYDAQDVLRRLPAVTGVMKGEGEKTFAELCKYYLKNENNLTELKDIDGITFRGNANEIIDNPWRMPMDLSEVPFVYNNMEDFENKIIYIYNEFNAVNHIYT